jgi:hypothetical protein
MCFFPGISKAKHPLAELQRCEDTGVSFDPTVVYNILQKYLTDDPESSGSTGVRPRAGV